MPRALEDGLQALSHKAYDATLDGLEGAVWARLRERRANAASPGVQAGVVAAALAIGLIVGIGAASKPASPYGSEVRVLSDDRLAPSIRLGGV